MGLNSAQSLHHFIAQSPGSVIEVRERRLSRTLTALKGEKITVVIDERGRKKGKKTDKAQALGLDLVATPSSQIVS